MTDNSTYVALSEIAENIAALTEASLKTGEAAGKAVLIFEECRLELKRCRIALDGIHREIKTR